MTLCGFPCKQKHGVLLMVLSFPVLPLLFTRNQYQPLCFGNVVGLGIRTRATPRPRRRNTNDRAATANDFTGPVTINGGILSVGTMAASGSASTLGAGTTVVLNGGTFQFTGARPAAGVVNRLWTLGSNGGTVQSTTATFFMANTISGPGSLTDR